MDNKEELGLRMEYTRTPTFYLKSPSVAATGTGIEVDVNDWNFLVYRNGGRSIRLPRVTGLFKECVPVLNVEILRPLAWESPAGVSLGEDEIREMKENIVAASYKLGALLFFRDQNWEIEF